MRAPEPPIRFALMGISIAEKDGPTKGQDMIGRRKERIREYNQFVGVEAAVFFDAEGASPGDRASMVLSSRPPHAEGPRGTSNLDTGSYHLAQSRDTKPPRYITKTRLAIDPIS